MKITNYFLGKRERDLKILKGMINMKLKDLRAEEGKIFELANSETIQILKVKSATKILIQFQSKRKYECETSHERIKKGNIVNPYSDINRNSFGGYMGVPRKYTKKEKTAWNNLGISIKNKGKKLKEEYLCFEDYLKILESKPNYKKWLSTDQYKIVYDENLEELEIVEISIGKRVYVKNIWTGNIECFSTVKECADEFGLNEKTIRKYCNTNAIVDGEQFSFYK